jgi:stage IV sporulation protein B
MKHNRIKGISLFLFIIFVLSAFAPTYSYAHSGSDYAPAFAVDPCENIDFSVGAKQGDYKISSRFYELLFGKGKSGAEEIYLVPGGEVFGIKLKEELVSVTATKDSSSAFRKGDKIVSVNGIEINEISDVVAALEDCKGAAVSVQILRKGEKMTLTVIPKYEDGAYKLGITLKDTACGIGTVTFVSKDTGVFGGLGHGVCSADGELIDICYGEACNVILGTAKRGETGKPGELSGILGQKRTGSISLNSECGVFGVLDTGAYESSTAIPIAKRGEVKVGEAEILSTVKGAKKASYKIEITEIDTNSKGSKSFKIKVTDATLISLTGGIVRGMSGSPIIQDGKLIGAVTHVMVADPCEGYGIFIENMLSAAGEGALPKAA